MSQYNVHAYLHTLATIYAEMNKVSEAKQLIFKILNKRGDQGLTNADYYILGRNAETMGLPDTAKIYYKKVKKNEVDEYLTVYELTKQRLKGLQ